MTLNDYQTQAIKTDLMGGPTGSASDPAFVAKVLGLVGEAGEVAEKFKKIIRDKDGKVSESDKQEITKELGDVLWYVATVSLYLDIPLQAVADKNLEKLFSRKARGTGRGSGDNR